MDNPFKHMNYQRFDVTAKYMFLRYLECGIKSDFGTRVYEHHLKVWNGLHELQPVKDGLQDYIDNFLVIKNNIQKGTFDWNASPIIIDGRGDIINGSHRLAAALFFMKNVNFQQGTIGETCSYDHLHSYRNNIPTGLDQRYSDAMAIEYCRMFKRHKNVYVVTVFPSAQGKEDEIRNIIRKYADIVYHKTVKLTKNGGKNFIRQVYYGEKWCGGLPDKYSGAKQKSDPCYCNDGPTRVYLIQANSHENTMRIKAEIRSLFNLGKHSAHINDTFEETWRLVNLLFNKNSIKFMNTITDDTLKMPNFQKFIKQMRKYQINNNQIIKDHCCVDSSAVLSAYGLRDCKDLDYIHGDCFPTKAVNQDITSHNGWAHHYCIPRDEIIYDPANYFYYNDLKFCTLKCVRDMKIKRNEEKDRKDVKLIKKIIKE